jgi:hypothetical protein
MVVVGTAAGLGLAAAYVPAFVWPDARVPDSLSISLQSARRQLWAEAADGLRLPLHFSFVDSRCASDGSLALIFEEHRPPYLERRFAYVARGSAPMTLNDAWSGGFGIAGSVLDDVEFVHVMGSDTTPCER